MIQIKGRNISLKEIGLVDARLDVDAQALVKYQRLGRGIPVKYQSTRREH